VEIYQAPTKDEKQVSQQESYIADKLCNRVASSLRGSTAIKRLMLQLGDGIDVVLRRIRSNFAGYGIFHGLFRRKQRSVCRPEGSQAATVADPLDSPPDSAMQAGPLNAQDLFNLADLVLDFAGRLLDRAFVFQIRIIGKLTRLFLDLALHFVKRALRLVLGTWFQSIFLLFLFGLFAKHRRVLSSPARISPAPTTQQKQHQQNNQYRFHVLPPL
jgi:hypothetical protein